MSGVVGTNLVAQVGFIVKDIENGVMYDLTLDSSLELKKSDFPPISGLKISD